MTETTTRDVNDPMICAPRYTQEQVDFARETDDVLRWWNYRATLIGTGGNCSALEITWQHAPDLPHVLVVTDHAAPQADDHLTLVLAVSDEQDDDQVLVDEQPMTYRQVATAARSAIHRQINGNDPQH